MITLRIFDSAGVVTLGFLLQSLHCCRRHGYSSKLRRGTEKYHCEEKSTLVSFKNYLSL